MERSLVVACIRKPCFLVLELAPFESKFDGNLNRHSTSEGFVFYRFSHSAEAIRPATGV
jgi:hypothetical protein